jgi:hypothetical protein
MAATAAANIGDLPPELIELIAAYLPTKDLCCGLMLASRYLHACIPPGLVARHKKYHRASLASLASQGDLSGLQFIFGIRQIKPDLTTFDVACGRGHIAVMDFLDRRGFGFCVYNNYHNGIYLAFANKTISIPLMKYMLSFSRQRYLLEDLTSFRNYAYLFDRDDMMAFLDNELKNLKSNIT